MLGREVADGKHPLRVEVPIREHPDERRRERAYAHDEAAPERPRLATGQRPGDELTDSVADELPHFVAGSLRDAAFAHRVVHGRSRVRDRQCAFCRSEEHADMGAHDIAAGANPCGILNQQQNKE